MMLHRSLALILGLTVACSKSPQAGDASDTKVVDVEHTDIERQSIGNCWIYAEAGWIESLHKSATGESFDVSESYLSYWHWFKQIRGNTGEVSTGGSFYAANSLIRQYGIMAELAFVPDDSDQEISYRQSEALSTINASLRNGALSSPSARADRALVRRELNRAFDLDPQVVAQLDNVFGEAGERGFGSGDADNAGTEILRADQLPVRYAQADANGSVSTQTRTLADAIRDWRSMAVWEVDRQQQIRMQRALHARQPVLISWAVDFNALEGDPDSDLRGSFNMSTLNAAGEPGRQGYHMVSLEDYEVVTQQYGTLKAGITLDPANPQDAAKLAAALEPSSRLVKLRVKNSWGSDRPDRQFVPGMPGYHDLYMNYLNGPITWCSEGEVEGDPSERGCNQAVMPLNEIILPPGF